MNLELIEKSRSWNSAGDRAGSYLESATLPSHSLSTVFSRDLKDNL